MSHSLSATVRVILLQFSSVSPGCILLNPLPSAESPLTRVIPEFWHRNCKNYFQMDSHLETWNEEVEMSENGKYVYCIIKERETKHFDFAGIDGSPVYLISFKDISAVVSDVEPNNCDPTRGNLLIHTVVLEKLMGEYTVLPVCFGTVTEDKKTVQGMLGRSYSGFKGELTRLEDKIELGLRILWNKNAVLKEIEGGGEDLEELREKAAFLSETEAQDVKLKIGKLVVSVLEKWEKHIRAIYGQLKEISSDSRVNEPIGANMIFDSSFLVDKRREEEFDRRVSKLDQEYGDKLKFKYVGPLPPYNFVSLDFEWR